MSYAQVFAPLLILGVGSTVLCDHVAGSVVPAVHYEKRNLQQYVIKQLENLGEGRNRTLLLPDGGGSLLVGAYKGLELWRVEVDLERRLQSRFVPEIRDQLPQRLPESITVLAQMGRLEIPPERHAVIIHLRGVEILIPEKTPEGDRFYQRFSITDTLSIPLSFEQRPPGIKDLDSAALDEELTRLYEELDKDPESATLTASVLDARTEKQRRLGFSLSCLTLPFIGACLSFLFGHRGRLMPFFLGNLVAVGVFYPLLMIGSSLADRGVVPELVLALPNLALVGLGALLAKRVVRQ